jgi:hypothetical protein
VTVHEGALQACLEKKLFLFILKSRKPFDMGLNHQKGFPLITL